ncbi:uncharacterized protein LAESUDRAFT_814014 [Laetiporus sulphureus 93-53]|uniref:Uncharacterized protein n=1 Tax=Laetiporus sulphureus 93-53 TaxID=1314785 RepID=A0A165DDR3_9APHY|nr:uncharacterized protein LAESUDRAFT_814014 [Laetiporus sulphureus 93-53]KZT04655.1 hypothetical protein LAESUDRAFT_814014 [Laetiporus sulphureus 93-53]
MSRYDRLRSCSPGIASSTSIWTVSDDEESYPRTYFPHSYVRDDDLLANISSRTHFSGSRPPKVDAATKPRRNAPGAYSSADRPAILEDGRITDDHPLVDLYIQRLAAVYNVEIGHLEMTPFISHMPPDMKGSLNVGKVLDVSAVLDIGLTLNELQSACILSLAALKVLYSFDHQAHWALWGKCVRERTAAVVQRVSCHTPRLIHSSVCWVGKSENLIALSRAHFLRLLVSDSEVDKRSLRDRKVTVKTAVAPVNPPRTRSRTTTSNDKAKLGEEDAVAENRVRTRSASRVVEEAEVVAAENESVLEQASSAILMLANATVSADAAIDIETVEEPTADEKPVPIEEAASMAAICVPADAPSEIARSAPTQEEPAVHDESVITEEVAAIAAIPASVDAAVATARPALTRRSSRRVQKKRTATPAPEPSSLASATAANTSCPSDLAALSAPSTTPAVESLPTTRSSTVVSDSADSDQTVVPEDGGSKPKGKKRKAAEIEGIDGEETPEGQEEGPRRKSRRAVVKTAKAREADVAPKRLPVPRKTSTRAKKAKT